jgi:opacity protein-like surface antigen
MLRSTLTVLLLALSASAAAEDFSYNYLYLGYGGYDVDDVNVDGNGLGVGGSFEISDKFHVFAGYQAADLDFNVDATTWNAGLGYSMAVSDVIDLVGRVSYESIKLDVPGFGSADDNGIGLGVGLRFAATPNIELDAGIDYVDYSDSGSDTAFGVGVLYNINEMFTVGVDGSWGDNFTTYALTGRFYFGQ